VVIQVYIPGFAVAPLEDKPPLIIDSDGMQALQFAPQLLEMIARRNAKIGVVRCIVKQLQLAKQPVLQVGRNFSGAYISFEKILQPVITPTDYHFAL
jgi:hypothetical protein